MAGSVSSSVEAAVTQLAEQVAAHLGMEVVLAEVKGGPGRATVRVYIDKAGGVTLDDCERFSQRLSVLLDVEDSVPFSYNLEVSSPGLDRPLTRASDFERFAGRQVKMRTRSPREGQRNFRGKLLGSIAGMVRVEIAPGKELEIAFTEIEKANLVIEI